MSKSTDKLRLLTETLTKMPIEVLIRVNYLKLGWVEMSDGSDGYVICPVVEIKFN